MESSYSIIYVSLNSNVQEQIAIGLLFTNGQDAYFHYSEEKFKHINKLISPESFDFIRQYLSGLTANIKDSRLASTDYLNYLSNYRNNLITFSKPVIINLELTIFNFKNLFQKFIYENERYDLAITDAQILHTENLSNIVERNLYSKIKSHVNLNKELTSKDIPTLFIPVKVSFIGRNENPVTGEVIDFESKFNTVSNKIGQYVTLIKAFELGNELGKFYVIGKEPDKNKFPQQHDTWSHINNSNLIEFVDVDETDKVSIYMVKHNVIPFLI